MASISTLHLCKLFDCINSLVCPCRPRVGFEEVSDLGEIQRFYLILSPGGDAKKSPNRLLVIGESAATPADRFRAEFVGSEVYLSF